MPARSKSCSHFSSCWRMKRMALVIASASKAGSRCSDFVEIHAPVWEARTKEMAWPSTSARVRWTKRCGMLAARSKPRSTAHSSWWRWTLFPKRPPEVYAARTPS